MCKRWFGFFQLFGHGHPYLQAMQFFICMTQVFGRALRVYDTMSGGHPVHGSRLYLHGRTQAVAVHDSAFEQVGKCRQANMRMWWYIYIVILVQVGRAHMIYENERPYHALAAEG